MRYNLLLLLALFIAPIAQAADGGVSAPIAETSTELPELVLTVNDFQEKISPNELATWVAHETLFQYDPTYRLEIENDHYCPPSTTLCHVFSPVTFTMHRKKTDAIILQNERLQSYLEDVARRFNRDPVDAKLQMENGRVTVFEQGQSGIRIDVPASLSRIAAILKNGPVTAQTSVALEFEKLEPNVNNSAIDELGIRTLIGEGTSNFRGSPKNRVYNINVATERFNGILIKPGEEFSFVSVLGEVDGEHGYLPELVIKKDKTEPEFGGGICQVSTTAFRAAIYSGLEITARRNHAYPVRYYNPQGMDATVYVPRPDLRFVNNTPGHILIQTKIEGTTLKFQFYGTDDGRKTTVDGPYITQRNPDGSMKASFTQTVQNQDGAVVINDTFRSNYDSPDKYPHPGQEPTLTTKPKGWSDREWKRYKSTHGV